MRRIALLFAVLTSAQSLSVRAQDPAAPTFRAGTTLIEFTIVARDAQGNPIADLTKDDIVVTENGQPRAVEFFRFDGAPPQASPNALPPGHFTNRFETSPNAPRHITAILIDAMNMMAVAKTMQFTQATIRNQILAYLDGLPPHTRAGLFRLGRGKIDVLHDFTDDVASLRAQAAKMDLLLPELFDTPGHRPADAPPSGVSGSAESAAGRAQAEAAFAKATGAVNELVQTNRVDLTLPELEALGNHLARFPGRKNIVWVGNGMPLYLGGSRARRGRDYEPRMRQTAERLATQGVAVYPIAQPANPLSPSVLRLDGQMTSAAAAEPRAFDFRMQIALDDVHFRESGGTSVAEIEIATAEKLASGDFSFRVERASLGRTTADPGALAPYARRWILKPETRTVRVIVRDRFTGRYGTLDIATNP